MSILIRDMSASSRARCCAALFPFFRFLHFCPEKSPNLNQFAINGYVVLILYLLNAILHKTQPFICRTTPSNIWFVYYYRRTHTQWLKLLRFVPFIELLLNIRWYWNLLVWLFFFHHLHVFPVEFMVENIWWYDMCVRLHE